MIGITSFGGYIPRRRMERMTIFQNMGWYMPATMMVAQGERSFCNWDEDSLTMAVAAARDSLIGLDKSRVDAVYLASTTLPFADRQNAGIVKGALNLADSCHTNDFTSSLKSGTSAMMAALSAVRSGDRDQVLVVAADKRLAKAAGFYEMWFGDGAAAVTIGRSRVVAEYLGGHSLSLDFVDHFRGAGRKFDYTWEERWVRDAGYSEIIPRTVGDLFEKLNISIEDVDKLVFPCFFKSEHRKIAKKLGASPEKVADNMHEVCGECGTAHPLIMLSRTLEDCQPGDRVLVAGFGQGCDALYFRVTDEILQMAGRSGVKGSLERKKVESNYTKFLKFRGLIETETGIRAEAPTQTAMTVLWRQRKMLSGLVGGRCTKCGTPQFPRMDICVNPECLAHHSQEDYEFSDRPAAIKTFTGDFLAVSQDPPAIYGMIQFEGGGRMLADFTDCELDDVFVGQPVEMSYRRRIEDLERGFSGYFWKAVPDTKAKRPEPAGEEIRFDGQVAVVTGAGGGLGRAYALELARRGAKVVVNDLGGARDGSGDSKSPADEVVGEIEALGGEAVASYDSVATVEGGQAVIDRAVDSFGRVDILINNAGILRDKTLVKMEEEDFQQVLSVHLRGAFNVTRPALQKMRENNYGRIVMTTSAAGLFGNFGQTNYSAAKLGLVGLMNSLKLEGQKYNVKVNTVAPVARTRLTEELLPPDLTDKLKPEFVAPLVVYLCSKECEGTGQIFNAGMGYFNRAAIVSGKGTFLGDGKVPTPEQVFKNIEAIDDLSGAEERVDAMAALTPVMGGPGGGSGEPAPASDGGPDVAEVFARMPDAFQADKAAGVDVVFQYVISGSGGGEWHAVIKDQKCTVSEGKHDSPTTTIRMSADDFMALIGGRLNSMQAYTSGKLKIDGDLMKSQLIEKLFSF